MKYNYNIYVGIITYNPNIERLNENINAVIDGAEIIIVDNNSENINDIEYIINKYPNIKIIKNSKNLGIAKALNQAMEYGYMNSYDWMLTLDQDSVCPFEYINKMSNIFNVEKKIGIVAPTIIDRNTGIVGHKINNMYKLVRTCISSGSFVNIKAWKDIGGYDESMFIDSVDFEFCYRMRKNKYKILQTSDIKLLHEIGNRRNYKFLFWKVKVNGHSAFRKYYIARNNIYYPLKHNLWLHFLRGNFRNLLLLISVLLYEEDKVNKYESILKGWKNGLVKGIQK